ncbi:MAG: 4Fe-4S dicluster domain-containing protein [Myxococcota bacterium]
MARTSKAIEKTRRAAKHPDRPGEKCNSEPGTWLPVINHARCEGKADCVDVCPHGVFEVRTIAPGDFQRLSVFAKLKSMAHARKTAYADSADRCRACGLCVVACPERAIRLEPPRRAG